MSSSLDRPIFLREFRQSAQATQSQNSAADRKKKMDLSQRILSFYNETPFSHENSQDKTRTTSWTLFLTSFRMSLKKDFGTTTEAHEGFEPPTSESKSDVITTTLMGHTNCQKYDYISPLLLQFFFCLQVFVYLEVLSHMRWFYISSITTTLVYTQLSHQDKSKSLASCPPLLF